MMRASAHTSRKKSGAPSASGAKRAARRAASLLGVGIVVGLGGLVDRRAVARPVRAEVGGLLGGLVGLHGRVLGLAVVVLARVRHLLREVLVDPPRDEEELVLELGRALRLGGRVVLRAPQRAVGRRVRLARRDELVEERLARRLRVL